MAEFCKKVEKLLTEVCKKENFLAHLQKNSIAKSDVIRLEKKSK